MDQIAEPTQQQSLEGFKPLLIIEEVLGAVLVILMIIWTTSYRGGFAWTSDIDRQFNWHPLLMTIGFVYLSAKAMLVYRAQRNVRKRRLKLTHAILLMCSIICAIIGLKAVFDTHNLKKDPIPNMYTLHSWIGLTTVILFCCQWVVGCVSFLYPGVQVQLRASYMPIHVFFGCATFIGAIASCLIGLNEKAIWAIPAYSKFVSEGLLVNVMGVFFILFGGVTMYLVAQERYRRLPRPEDEILLNGRAE